MSQFSGHSPTGRRHPAVVHFVNYAHVEGVTRIVIRRRYELEPKRFLSHVAYGPQGVKWARFSPCIHAVGRSDSSSCSWRYIYIRVLGKWLNYAGADLLAGIRGPQWQPNGRDIYMSPPVRGGAAFWKVLWPMSGDVPNDIPYNIIIVIVIYLFIYLVVCLSLCLIYKTRAKHSKERVHG